MASPADTEVSTRPPACSLKDLIAQEHAARADIAATGQAQLLVDIESPHPINTYESLVCESAGAPFHRGLSSTARILERFYQMHPELHGLAADVHAARSMRQPTGSFIVTRDHQEADTIAPRFVYAGGSVARACSNAPIPPHASSGDVDIFVSAGSVDAADRLVRAIVDSLIARLVTNSEDPEWAVVAPSGEELRRCSLPYVSVMPGLARVEQVYFGEREGEVVTVTRRWDIILRVYLDVSHVLYGFDLGPSKVMILPLEGQVCATPLGEFCIANSLLVTSHLWSSTTEPQRILKYVQRGYGLVLQDLTVEEFERLSRLEPIGLASGRLRFTPTACSAVRCTGTFELAEGVDPGASDYANEMASMCDHRPLDHLASHYAGRWVGRSIARAVRSLCTGQAIAFPLVPSSPRSRGPPRRKELFAADPDNTAGCGLVSAIFASRMGHRSIFEKAYMWALHTYFSLSGTSRMNIFDHAVEDDPVSGVVSGVVPIAQGRPDTPLHIAGYVERRLERACALADEAAAGASSPASKPAAGAASNAAGAAPSAAASAAATSRPDPSYSYDYIARGLLYDPARLRHIGITDPEELAGILGDVEIIDAKLASSPIGRRAMNEIINAIVPRYHSQIWSIIETLSLRPYGHNQIVCTFLCGFSNTLSRLRRHFHELAMGGSAAYYVTENPGGQGDFTGSLHPVECTLDQWYGRAAPPTTDVYKPDADSRIALVAAAGRAPAAPPPPAPEHPTCALCLEDLDPRGGLMSVSLSCGHAFHVLCEEPGNGIARWFMTASTCPQCRADVASNIRTGVGALGEALRASRAAPAASAAPTSRAASAASAASASRAASAAAPASRAASAASASRAASAAPVSRTAPTSRAASAAPAPRAAPPSRSASAGPDSDSDSA